MAGSKRRFLCKTNKQTNKRKHIHTKQHLLAPAAKLVCCHFCETPMEQWQHVIPMMPNDERSKSKKQFIFVCDRLEVQQCSKLGIQLGIHREGRIGQGRLAQTRFSLTKRLFSEGYRKRRALHPWCTSSETATLRLIGSVI